MPSKTFPLEPGGRDRVEASWEGAFKGVRISFDGSEVAFFASEKDLAAPRVVSLPDGSELEIVVAKYGFLPELRLARDGVPLPGSSGDPAAQLGAAANVLYAIAALNAVIGAIAGAFGVEALHDLGIGWPTLVAAAVYAALGWLVSRRHAAALMAAMALFVADGVFTVALAARAGATPPVGGILMRVFFLMPMFRGLGAIRALAEPPQPRPRSQRPSPAGSPRGGGSAAPHATSTPATPSPHPPSPVARVLSGEAEKKRLALTERQAAPAPTVAGRRRETKGPAGVDAAKKSLRFIAHKVEFTDAGLRVTETSGARRDVPFADVARVFARQLPPDPPWDAAMFVDIVPSAGDPVRVFGTTTVNYASLGGSSTSRLENTRRLVGFLREKCPGAALDDATRAFAEGPKVPLKFANMTQFLEYDGALDAPHA